MEKYTKELLEKAVKNSFSVFGVLRYLGLKPAGGTHTYISNKIRRLEIDRSHFTGKAHNKGKPTHNKKSFKEVLIKRKSYSKEKSYVLRRAMIESGIEYSCKICGIKEWNQKDIILEIHHLDGNNMNNIKSNLEFHCPNCHSQTSNFSGKANKRACCNR